MSSMSNRRSSKQSTNKKMLSFMAKQMAKVIPEVVSKIQASASPHGSVDSRAESSKTTSFTFKQFNLHRPDSFTGNDGATAMLEWFDHLELVFINSECPEELRTRHATSVFKSRALEWWKSERATRGNEAALALPWEELKQLMIEEFCPAQEIERLEDEFWKLKQNSGDNPTYTNRFKQLLILVPHQFNTTKRIIAKYLKGLPTSVRDIVEGAEPTTLEKAIRLASKISDNQVKDGTLTIPNTIKIVNQTTTIPTDKPKEAETPSTHSNNRKRKSRNQNYAVTIPSTEAQAPTPLNQVPTRKTYTGPFPKCNTCHFHHPPTSTCC